MADAIREVTIRMNIEAGNVPKIDLPHRQQVESMFEAYSKGLKDLIESNKSLGEAVRAMAAADPMKNMKSSVIEMAMLVERLRGTVGAVGNAVKQAGSTDHLDDLFKRLDESTKRIEALNAELDSREMREYQKDVKAFAENLRDLIRVTTDFDQIEQGIEDAFDMLRTHAENNGIELTIQDLENLRKTLREAADKGVAEYVKEMEKLGRQNFLADQKESAKQFKLAVDTAKESMRDLANTGAPVREIGTVTDEVTASLVRMADQLRVAMSPADIERLRREIEDVAENSMQQFTDRTEAAGKAADRAEKKHRKAMMGISQGISSAAGAATQFIALMQTMELGDKDSLEEMAAAFVKIQATIQAVNAGQQTMNGMIKGLGDFNEVMTRAATRATATAGANSAAAASYRMLGTAAAGAQAVMGPLSAVLMVAGLAYTALQTATALWGDSAEDDAEKAAKAHEEYNKQLDESIKKLEMQSEVLRGQSDLLRDQLSLKEMLLEKDKGQALTPEEITQNFNLQREDMRENLNTELLKASQESKKTLTVAQLKSIDNARDDLTKAKASQKWLKSEEDQKIEWSPGEFMQAMERADANLQKALDNVERVHRETGVTALNTLPSVEEMIADPKRMQQSLDAMPTEEQRKPIRLVMMEAFKQEMGLLRQEKQAADSSAGTRESGADKLQAEVDDLRARLLEEEELARNAEEMAARKPQQQAKIDQQLAILDNSQDTKTRAKAADKLGELLSNDGKDLLSQEQRKTMLLGSETDPDKIRAALEDNQDATEEREVWEKSIAAKEEEIVALQEMAEKDLELQIEINQKIKSITKQQEELQRQLRAN